MLGSLGFGLLLLGVVISLLLLTPLASPPLSFQVISLLTNEPNEALLVVKVTNASGKNFQFPTDRQTTNWVTPQCDVIKLAPGAEVKWTPSRHRSYSGISFLNPGTEKKLYIPVPSDGRVRVGLWLKRLPVIRWSDNVLVRTIHRYTFPIRARIALLANYQPVFMPPVDLGQLAAHP